MRVAVVTRFPPDPKAPRGGVEAVSVHLVRALAGLEGLSVDVVTTSPTLTEPTVDDWDGVPIHRLPRRSGRILSDAIGPGRRQMRAYLTTLAPEVIHAHDVYGLMVKGMDVPRVFTIHGFIHGDTLLEGTWSAWIRSQIWRWVETGGWADQPHIISISPYVRERLAGVSTGVIHDIDNPIASDFFDVQRRAVPGRIFSAAWISRRKNTLGLLRGFAQLVKSGVDAELRLAGTASDKTYMQKIRRYIEQESIGGHVRFLGQINRFAVRQELAQAAAFVLASLEENSPMGIEEAMAAGVPVVTSNRCGMPYMVRDGETGFLIDPNDPGDIAWRLAQVLGEDQLSQAMSARARQIALDRFHPDAIARRTRAVYERALRDRERS